jgi:flagellar hook-associated protein FlgK
MPINPTSSAAAIGLSGLRAAQQRLDTHAHNIANAQTPRFQRQTVIQTAQPEGGVDTVVNREAAILPADAAGLGAKLVDDLVGQRLSLYSFAANLKTVQAQDDMLGALLDIQA